MIVSGSVLDNEMGILPNVIVTVLDENRETITDENGHFTIIANSSNSQLRFSLLGYDYDTISAGEFNQIGRIELYPSTTDLPEVIVNNNAKSSNAGLFAVLGVLAIGLIALASRKKVQSRKVVA